MQDQVILHTAFDAAAAVEPPKWLHLVPAGTFKGKDGRGPYVLQNAQAVIDASMAGGSIAVDENHSIDLAATSGAPSPARGWIVEMQMRTDGIWGRVDWNATGAQLMSERAYRGISPVILTAPKTGAVVRILRASLTNNPNLSDLQTLHQQGEPQMDVTVLRTALGLPETADEAAILERVTANATAVSTHATSIAAIAAAAGAKSIDPSGLVTELQAQRATAGDTHRMATEMVDLQTQLHAVKAERAREKAVTCIDTAIGAGKPVPAVLREHYITRHMADPAGVETELAAMVSLNTGGLSPAQVASLHGAGDGADADGLTAEEMAMAKKFKVDPKKMAAEKKAKEKKGV